MDRVSSVNAARRSNVASYINYNELAKAREKMMEGKQLTSSERIAVKLDQEARWA